MTTQLMTHIKNLWFILFKIKAHMKNKLYLHGKDSEIWMSNSCHFCKVKTVRLLFNFLNVGIWTGCFGAQINGK